VVDGVDFTCFNQFLFSTETTLSPGPRLQLLRFVKMPTQVPIGAKSQVADSLWTTLIMGKAGLFIARAALGPTTEKSSYFQIHVASKRLRK